MNIFVTDTCPIASAQALDDVRLNKMIVESAQLLSTALRIKGVDDPVLYRISHTHHPCCHWVRRNRSNFMWLWSHAQAMLNERIIRGSLNQHATTPVIVACMNHVFKIPEAPLEPFHNSSLFKDNPDVIQAYRDTMNHKWDTDIIKVTWRNRGAPPWRTK